MVKALSEITANSKVFSDNDKILLDQLNNTNEQYFNLFFNSTLKIGKSITDNQHLDYETDKHRIETLKNSSNFE